MPIYNFENVKTKEVIEKMCSIAVRDEMVESGEWVVIHLGAASVGDPVRLGIRKPDETFKDLLREMKKNHSQGITRSKINDW